jgi:hypothetical protein
MQIAKRGEAGGLRQDALWAVAETAALFLIFLVAFTGRDAFGDAVKTLLTILSIVAGGAGIAGGLAVGRRGLVERTGKIARFALAGWMLFAGAYTIVHVLS